MPLCAHVIATARAAADLLLFDGCAEEKAHLDSDQRLIGTRDAFKGGRDQVDLPIPAIIEEALRLRSAGIILAHNHPSGDSRPSEADLAGTRELAATAASLGFNSTNI